MLHDTVFCGRVEISKLDCVSCAVQPSLSWTWLQSCFAPRQMSSSIWAFLLPEGELAQTTEIYQWGSAAKIDCFASFEGLRFVFIHASLRAWRLNTASFSTLGINQCQLNLTPTKEKQLYTFDKHSQNGEQGFAMTSWILVTSLHP